MIVVLQAEDGIRVLVRSRGLGDVYKRQVGPWLPWMGMSEVASNSRHVAGVLVYHVRSETRTQFEDLPVAFRNRMQQWFDNGALGPVSYTHLTLPTSDLV